MLAVTLAGCDVVLGLQRNAEIPPGGDGGQDAVIADAAPDAPFATCHEDTFSTLSAQTWTLPVPNTNPGIFFTSANNQLTIDFLTTSNDVTERMRSAYTVSFGGSRLSAELVQKSSTGTISWFGLETVGGASIYRVQVSSTLIQLFVDDASKFAMAAGPMARYLRLRHDPIDKTVVFESGVDPALYAERFRTPASMMIDSLQIVFAGSGTPANDTSAIWDNLRYECTP